MIHKPVSTVALFIVAGAVSACNSPGSLYRQGPWGPASTPRSYPEYSAPWGGRPVILAHEAAVQPVYDEGRVIEAPLHPVPKGYAVHLEPDLPPGFPPARPMSDVKSGLDPLPAPEQSPPLQREASAAAGANAPGVFTPPQRASSYAGTWKARVGSASCRIQLSSVSSLDLYKASAQGCSDNALKAVNGWSIRDNQVILFSRGEVVARMSGAEAALSGTLNGSKAELTMTR